MLVPNHLFFYLVLDRPTLSLTGNVSLLVGSQISIQCLVSSSSPNSVQYEWYKEGQKISTKESILHITYLRTDDAGIYSCVAKLGELFEASQTSLVLNVQGKLLKNVLLITQISALLKAHSQV